jgi:DNA-binding MarR family transcriptional regulator
MRMKPAAKAVETTKDLLSMSNEQKGAREELLYFRMVRVLHGAYNRLQRGLLKAGVTAPQFEVISLVFRMNDVKLKEIGQRLLITGGNLTGIMDRLEKTGLILRIRDTDDRRIIKAKLTPKGLETFQRADRLYKQELREIFKDLDGQQKRILSGLLRKLESKAQSKIGPTT